MYSKEEVGRMIEDYGKTVLSREDGSYLYHLVDLPFFNRDAMFNITTEKALELMGYEMVSTSKSHIVKDKVLRTYSKTTITDENNIKYKLSFTEVDSSDADLYFVKIKAEGIFNICNEMMTLRIEDGMALRKIIELIHYKAPLPKVEGWKTEKS